VGCSSLYMSSHIILFLSLTEFPARYLPFKGYFQEISIYLIPVYWASRFWFNFRRDRICIYLPLNSPKQSRFPKNSQGCFCSTRLRVRADVVKSIIGYFRHRKAKTNQPGSLEDKCSSSCGCCLRFLALIYRCLSSSAIGVVVAPGNEDKWNK